MNFRITTLPFVLAAACYSYADDPAVTLSSANIAETSNVLLGWTFTPSADIYVTGLGYIDLGADGMNTSRQVGIIDASTNSIVTSATLAAGIASTKIGFFRYADADGAKLTAGNRYLVAATNVSDSWATNTTSSPTFAPEIVPDGKAYYAYGASTLGFPGNLSGYNQYFGPSFTFSTQPVPEPASLGAVAAGLLAVAKRRRSKANKKVG